MAILSTTMNVAALGANAADDTLNITGCPRSQASVTFTANGASDATNNQLLALSADSTATGVGIAIYNKGGEFHRNIRVIIHI